jgi:glycosyltransferase involved in cell wall biosynthesis
MGGVETYTRDLFDELERHGHDNVVVVAGEMLAGVEKMDRMVQAMPDLVSSRVSAGSAAADGLASLIKKEDPGVAFLHTAMNYEAACRVIELLPTVFFAHNYGAFCPAGALLYERNGRVCQLPNTPNWRCLVNAYVERCNTRHPRRLIKSFVRSQQTGRWLDKTQAIVCDSTFVAERHSSAGYDRSCIHVLPTPVPIPPFPGEAGTSAQSGYLLYAGRLVQSKGLGVLLEALREVPQRWRLRVAGAGHDDWRFRQLARDFGVDDRVDFIGQVSREELTRIYADAAVVVVPSIWPEPLGMIGVEALALGRPVVASAVGGTGEWLIDEVTGLAAVPGNAGHLARQIVRLVEDRKLASRLGGAGRELVMRRFGLGTHVDRLIQVFETAIVRHPVGIRPDALPQR